MLFKNKGAFSFFIGLLMGMGFGLSTYYLMNNNQQQPLLVARYPESHVDLAEESGPTEEIRFHDHNEPMHKNEDKLSKQLFDRVKILCWVLTSPANHDKKAKHVYATWGKRCNKIIFMSSGPHETLPVVQLKVEEGHDKLWGKTKAAFKYVHDNHIDEYDWFYKADDDTYAIMENMRYMLSIYDPLTPIYFGHKFSPYVRQGYMSGGAGYILSRGALKKFVESSLPNKNKCKQKITGSEDVEMGKCLMNVGVIAGDSRDEFGRKRFFPFVPAHHLIPGLVPKKSWFWKYTYYEQKEGMSCCSDTAISFHYVSPNLMYEMEYLIYHLTPFGISRQFHFPPALPPDLSAIPKDMIAKFHVEEYNDLNSTDGTKKIILN